MRLVHMCRCYSNMSCSRGGGTCHASCEVIACLDIVYRHWSHLGNCSRSWAGSQSIEHFQGLGCLLQSLKHCQLLMLFCGTYYKCCWVWLWRWLSFVFTLLVNALMHRNQGEALVHDGTNLKQWYWTLIKSKPLGMIVKSWFKVDRFPQWLQYLKCCWIHPKAMVMWPMSYLFWSCG